MTQRAPDTQVADHVQQKARGSGAVTELPPAANAASLFRAAIEELSAFVELLPSRTEQRQGERFVVSYAKPRSRAPERGENRVYIEAPPDAERDEHGHVSFTPDQAYRRVAGGASRYPDDHLTAAIVAALLTGAAADELVDLLHPEPTQEVREQAREFAGEQDPPDRLSLKLKARQFAALVCGYPVGKGKRTNSASKE
jgi:hypothetical protein